MEVAVEGALARLPRLLEGAPTVRRLRLLREPQGGGRLLTRGRL